MYKADTKEEKLESGLARLHRLYNHYEKALNYSRFSMYYKTLNILNKIEHKITRYQEKLKEAHHV